MKDWRKVSLVWWAFCTNMLTMGPIKVMGIYFLQFQLHLNASPKEASVVLSLVYATYFFSGPVATVLCNFLGYRWTSIIGVLLAAAGTGLSSLSPTIKVVYVTLGIFIGLGGCCVMTPIYAILGQIFANKRPLVNNVVTTGSALSSIPLSILTQIWIDWYGWRGSLLLMSGVLLQCLVCSQLVMNMASRCDANMFAKKRTLFDFSLLKSGSFLAYCLACGFHMSSMTLVSVYLVRFAQSRGVTDLAAAALPGIIGAVDTVLKPATGYLFSRKKICGFTVKRLMILSGCVVTQALSTLFLPFANYYAAIVAVVVAYATCIGFSGALPLTVLADLYGPEKLATSLGLRSFIMGGFAMTAPPLVGIYVEQTGNFSVPFFASTGATITAGMFFLLAKCFSARNRRNASEEAMESKPQEEPSPLGVAETPTKAES